MSFEAVNWQETFAIEASAKAPEAKPEAKRVEPRERYNLATAVRIVRRMETSATRGAVFAEIKNKNALYRLIDELYSKAEAIQPLVLFAYMLKCILSIGPFGADEDADAVAISNFPNERHAANRLAALVPDARLLRLSMSRKHMFGRGQWDAAVQLVRIAPRIWPLLTRLAHSHDFMPSARIASALAFYIRFVNLLRERPGLGAVVVASNYSPEAVGLAAAAHRTGRQVIYINHAPVPANGALVPPVLADCAIFYGDVIRQTYESRSRCTAEVALIGQPWTARPMQWRDEAQTVGIFLTALTRADAVAELVSAIRAGRPAMQVLIRHHPVALLKTDFSALERDPLLRFTIGTPLDDDITACDLIFCGNSGVAMNALSGGRPVAYLDTLDGLNFDYNGFIENGLVCHVEGWSDNLYNRLKRFYFKPQWQSVMRSYDASYGAETSELERAAAETVRRYLKPTSAPPPTVFPVQLRA